MAGALVPVKQRSVLAKAKASSRKHSINFFNFCSLNRSPALRAVVLGLALAGSVLGVGAAGGVDASLRAVANGFGYGSSYLGLAISEVTIVGHGITTDQEVLENLGITARSSIVTYDVAEARARLLGLPSVSDVSISKYYPAKLQINITEHVPVARWQYGGQMYLVDVGGRLLGNIDAGTGGELPLVVGAGAKDHVAVILARVAAFPGLKPGIFAYSRIADRRWDIIYTNGLRIKLPADNVGLALEKLARLDVKHNLLGRDIAMIDLRVPGQTVVLPVARDAESLES